MTSLERALITLTVMLVAIIEVLDMTIVNVSLPPMKGSLGANNEQITWVLTSYVVSAAIVMPMTGFLVKRLGQRRLLLLNILGFGLASAACGLANSLTSMIVFRALQGVFGASLVPLSQFILRDTYPTEQHGKAMAIWGIGIMVAPVMGPTLGGYITEWTSWRWVFYINIPVCLLSWLLTLSLIKETPRQILPIDWLGLLLLAIGIGSLQIFLDQGNTKDWFQSQFIISLGILWLVSLSIFIVRGWRKGSENIIDLTLFKNRLFCLSEIALLLFVLAFFGVMSLQSILFESYMGYPARIAGLIMAPRGIASAVAMLIAGLFYQRFTARAFILLGVFLAIIGTYLSSLYFIGVSREFIMFSVAIQGLGMGFFFVPLSTIAFSTLPEAAVAEASGLFSFSRSLGISIGISLLSTYLSRSTQLYWHQLASNITLYQMNWQTWITQHAAKLSLSPIVVAGKLVQQQAGMLAFNRMTLLATALLILTLPASWYLQQRPRG